MTTTVGLDLHLIRHRDGPMQADLLILVAYTVSLTLVLAAIVGASPLLLIRPSRRRAAPDEWKRIRGALPILLGTLAWALLTASAAGGPPPEPVDEDRRTDRLEIRVISERPARSRLLGLSIVVLAGWLSRRRRNRSRRG